MARGRKTGGGSRKGKPNKRKAERAAAIQASGLTPLDYFMQLLRDEDAPVSIRFDAAKEAAPYVHSKLATVTHKGDPNAPVQLVLIGSDQHG